MNRCMFIFLLVIVLCKVKVEGSSWDQAVDRIGSFFKELEGIESLNLKGGIITDLPTDPGLPNLKRLYLNENKISYVSPTLFKQFLENLPELRLLDLSQNQLTKENMDELSKVAAEIKTKTGQHIKIITDITDNIGND